MEPCLALALAFLFCVVVVVVLLSATSKTAADDDAFVFTHASASARAEKLCERCESEREEKTIVSKSSVHEKERLVPSSVNVASSAYRERKGEKHHEKKWKCASHLVRRAWIGIHLRFALVPALVDARFTTRGDRVVLFRRL